MGDLSVFPLDQGMMNLGESARPFGGKPSLEGGGGSSGGDENPFVSALGEALAEGGAGGSDGVLGPFAFDGHLQGAQPQVVESPPQLRKGLAVGGLGFKGPLRQFFFNPVIDVKGEELPDGGPEGGEGELTSPSGGEVSSPERDIPACFVKAGDVPGEAAEGLKGGDGLPLFARGADAPTRGDGVKLVDAENDKEEGDPVGARLSLFIRALEEMERAKVLPAAGPDRSFGVSGALSEPMVGVPGSAEGHGGLGDLSAGPSGGSVADGALASWGSGAYGGTDVDLPVAHEGLSESRGLAAGLKDFPPRGLSKRGSGEDSAGLQGLSEPSRASRKDRPVPHGEASLPFHPQQSGLNGAINPASSPGAWPVRLGYTGEAALGEGLVRVFREVASGANRATVVVEPPSLGRVEVQLLLDGGELSARIRVENRELLGLVQAQSQRLKESLEAQGLQVSGLSVDLRNDERRPKEGPLEGRKRSSLGIRGDGEEAEDVPVFRVDLRNGLLHWLA
ncbi:flagellar hook-length control protein [Thermanaerovibrio velox DSM 12556]|uniref:Flagellar hook-length control protein n=1 Tax=Thermanaerovibrio velox DSM 12556 TaxID=926567 RepID=H0UPP9_9BACT|nr:flagellar hook-length control protein FliK [Thermanaerovibrio velox]EHM09596.1 flagellar hook-length control protein [Thermanaerovibrio velox DSM 12556]